MLCYVCPDPMLIASGYCISHLLISPVSYSCICIDLPISSYHLIPSQVLFRPSFPLFSSSFPLIVLNLPILDVWSVRPLDFSCNCPSSSFSLSSPHLSSFYPLHPANFTCFQLYLMVIRSHILFNPNAPLILYYTIITVL